MTIHNKEQKICKKIKVKMGKVTFYTAINPDKTIKVICYIFLSNKLTEYIKRKQTDEYSGN